MYAEDIVSIIKKSRRGIFILSPNYVNGPSVFELQAAVNLALDDQTLKLILIKFRSFQEPESLPYLVKKALRVLPTVTWKGLKSIRPNSRFWAQMRYHMPVKNSRRFKWNQLRIGSRFFFPTGKDSAEEKPLGGAPASGWQTQLETPSSPALGVEMWTGRRLNVAQLTENSMSFCQPQANLTGTEGDGACGLEPLILWIGQGESDSSHSAPKIFQDFWAESADVAASAPWLWTLLATVYLGIRVHLQSNKYYFI